MFSDLPTLMSIPTGFAFMALLLFLIIFCLLAYHYLRAQITSADPEIKSVYALKARKERLEKDLESLEEAKRTLEEYLGEPERERLRADKIKLESEYDEQFRRLENAQSEFNATELELVKQRSEKESLEKQIRDLEEKMAELTQKKESFELEVSQKAVIEQQKEELNEELADLQQRLKAKQSEYEEECAKLQRTWVVEKGKLQNLQDDVQRAEHELLVLAARKRHILAQGGEGEEKIREVDANARLFELPDVLKEPNYNSSSRKFEEELQFLDDFREKLRDNGISFSRRVLQSFHTALKCNDISPLTVLAGVSGTGKTLLPVKYAEYAGIPSILVPVQPRWDSHADLFGSYDYFDRKFQPTELARSLIFMDRKNNRGKIGEAQNGINWSDHLLLVILDEMNLARTEYYFSEFLSRLEVRRESEEKAVLYTGKGQATKVSVDTNVFFVGTMNEDESTQTLSDKVLDRANMMRFAAPSKHGKKSSNGKSPENRLGDGSLLTYDQWNQWVSSGDDKALEQKFHDSMDRLREIMIKLHRPFGHRLAQSIEQYVKRHPERRKSWKDPFCDQIEQRILPKLRGVQLTDAHREHFSDLQNLLDELDDKELSEGVSSSLDNEDMGLFFWNGIAREDS